MKTRCDARRSSSPMLWHGWEKERQTADLADAKYHIDPQNTSPQKRGRVIGWYGKNIYGRLIRFTEMRIKWLGFAMQCSGGNADWSEFLMFASWFIIVKNYILNFK